jgi:type IX secretion system PorP/SprF family membrane protein
MKKITGILSFVLAFNFANAQQMPQYSQYLRNQFMVNPAAAGVYDFTDVTVSGRMQWSGLENAIAPMTSYASICAPLTKKVKVRYNPSLRVSSGPVRGPEVNTGKSKHALGGQMVGDQYGAYRKLSFSATYAYHLKTSTNTMLSFGARVGLSNNSFFKDRAVVLNPSTDVTYIDYSANQASQNVLNIGAGLYFYSKKMFFGLSADNLSRDLVSFGTGSANFNTTIHANLTGGIKLKVNDNFTITPSFLVKYMNPAPPSIEATVQGEYKEWIWFGASYRNTDAVIVMAGLNISNRFKFGYSFDYSISRMNQYSNGGHELILGIMLGRTPTTSAPKI